MGELRPDEIDIDSAWLAFTDDRKADKSASRDRGAMPPPVRLPADAPAWGVKKLPARTAAVASIFDDYIPRFGDDL